MIIDSPIISGSSAASGSLNQFGNVTITGSLTVTGAITGAVTGSVDSASYASNAELLDGRDSTTFTSTSSFQNYTSSNDAQVLQLNNVSASFNSYTSSNNANIAALNAATASLYNATSSIYLATASIYLATASIYSATSSLFAYTASNSANVANLFATSASLNAAVADIRNATSSLYNATASIYGATSSLFNYSASSNLRIGSLEQYTASLNTRSASFACVTATNNFACTQYFSNASNAVSFTSTGSLYSDGGVRFTKDMYVSGTAFFNNVTIFGTQSVNYISSSQLNIGTNIISVNTDTPSVRFGGLSVYDSGSTGLTGSMLWDSEDNQWIYSNPSGSTYDSAMFLVGPRNSGVLGNETGITCNFISKGNGMHHMTSSGIFENGTTTCFYGNSFINSSGAACFNGSVTSTSLITTGMSGNVISIQGNETLNSPFGITWTTPTYTGGLAAIRVARRGATDASDMMFFTSPNGDVPNERLRITSDGVSCFSNRICATTGAALGNIVSYSYGSIRGYVGDTDGDCNMQVRAECALTIKTGGNNTRMTITPSGNVGIGTTTPTSDLNIQDTAICTLLTITSCYPASGAGDNCGVSGIMFQHYGNFVSPTIRNAGRILSLRECNYSTTELANSSLVFYTANNNTDTARLTIDSLGNSCFSTAVGIGGPVLASPYALTVWGCAVMYRNCDFIFHQPNSYTNGIAWKNTGYAKDSAAIRPIETAAYAIQGLGFYTGNFADTTTAPVLRLSILPSGISTFSSTVCAPSLVAGSTFSILGNCSAYICFYKDYSGSPSNPGFVIVNASGTTTLSHNSNGGATNMGGNLLVSGVGCFNSAVCTPLFLASGCIGIGMTAPASSLHIIRALGNDVFNIGESGTNTRFAIGQEAAYTGNYINSRNIDLKLQAYCAGGSGGNIHFQTGTDGTGCVTTKMFLCSTGLVGIGTLAPRAILSVEQDYTATAEFGSQGQLSISGKTNSEKRLSMGFNTSADVGFIQAMVNGTSYNNLLLNARGGNVGIGTTSPTSKLSVQGTQAELHVKNDATNTLTAGGWDGSRHYIKSINLGVALTPLTIQASSFNFDTGNVGIGITSPASKLHVVGTLRVTDTLSWASGDGVNWYIQGQANGPTIRMKYDGGSTNRSGALGWVDNGGGRYEALSWQDSTVYFCGTSGFFSPKGTTAERPSASCGWFRFNTSLRMFDGDGADGWGPLGIAERIIMNNYDPYTTTPQALCIIDNADGGGTTWTFNGSGIFGVTNSSGGHSGQWGPLVYMTPGAWRWRWTAIPTICDGVIHPSTPAAAYKCTIQVSFTINGVSTDSIKYDTCIFKDNMHIGGLSTPTYITTAGCFTVTFSTNGYEGVRKIWFKELVLEKIR